jgi:hypothetical protein
VQGEVMSTPVYRVAFGSNAEFASYSRFKTIKINNASFHSLPQLFTGAGFAAEQSRILELAYKNKPNLSNLCDATISTCYAVILQFASGTVTFFGPLIHSRIFSNALDWLFMAAYMSTVSLFSYTTIPIQY